jgi:hypothetical protein
MPSYGNNARKYLLPKQQLAKITSQWLPNLEDYAIAIRFGKLYPAGFPTMKRST